MKIVTWDHEGWGGEDDVLRRRIRSNELLIRKSSVPVIDLEAATIAKKLSHLKSQDQKNNFKWEQKNTKSGLSTLSDYSVVNIKKIKNTNKIQFVAVVLL